MAQGTLWVALQGIEDHRTKKGRRFPLPAIIAIALCAMLSGANDLMAIFALGGGSRRRRCRRSASTRSGAKRRAMRPTTTFSSRLLPMIWPRRSAVS